jgi:hypothetical protein
MHKFCATIFKKTVDNPQKLWYYINRKRKRTLHKKGNARMEGIRFPEGKTVTYKKVTAAD